MDEILVAPPVEDAIIQYLQERLGELGDTAHVSDKTHERRNVRVIKTGGLPTVALVLTSPQITLDCYDKTEGKAERLAALCSGLMFDLPGRVVTVSADGKSYDVVFAAVSHLGQAVNLPDPLDQRPRYTETFIPRCRVIPVSL